MSVNEQTDMISFEWRRQFVAAGGRFFLTTSLLPWEGWQVSTMYCPAEHNVKSASELLTGTCV